MLSLILIGFFISRTSATIGVDVSALCNEWSCLHDDHSIDFMITRGWESTGNFDSSAPTNLQNARSAGIQYTDVYMFPCRSQSATTQMDTLIADLAGAANGIPVKSSRPKGAIVAKGLQAGRKELEKRMKANNQTNFQRKKRIIQKSDIIVNRARPSWRPEQNATATYGMIWLDIEENPSAGCSWASYSGSSNCDYIQQLAQAGVAKGASIGVYSSEYEWETVVGSRDGCTEVNKYPLWYAHYDDSPSFSDYSSYSFGGWSTPAMKQYEGDATLCNFDVDMDYY